jgi:hypothetical protein
LIKKIAIYLIAFICLLFVYRAFLYTGIKKNKQGIFNKYNELFLKKGNTYDVLFIGSSRAEMHFNPRIFDSITGLNSYNMGISGATLKISYSLLKTYYQQHKTPKFLICNIDYFYLSDDTDSLNDFPRYFPYLDNIYLRNQLNTIDNRFTSFYYNPLHSLPYTQINFLSSSLHGWLNFPGKYDTLMYKGFQNIESENINLVDFSRSNGNTISIKNKNYIDSLILFSRKNKTQLMFVATPALTKTWKYNSSKGLLISQIQNIANTNQINFVNYTDSAISKEESLFSDNYHLNVKGSRQFSKSFSNYFNTSIIFKK